MQRTLAGLIAAVFLILGASWADEAHAQGKKLKIGVIFDYTGPLAGGGSDLHALGAKIMIDHFAKKGGVEGYQIEAVYADAQSKPDIAINEAVRLIEQEKVDMLLGFYSSAQCVPGGRPGRAAQEVHVDHHLHLLGGAREPEPQVRLPRPAERPPVRPDVDRLHRPERQGQARQGAQGPPRGDHPRGRRLRRRRVQGQRGGRQEGGLQHRPEGGLRGDRARSLAAGDQAQARPGPTSSSTPATTPTSRCSCASRASWGCASARWSATAPATASTTSSRSRSARTCNYFFNVDPISIWLANEKALKPQLPADDQDGRRGVREGASGHGGQVGPRRHGGQQHLRVHDRGAAAGHQEARRRSTPTRCARRRSRSTCRRAATMLGFGVKFAGRGLAHGRPERARVPGHRAVHRRQGERGVAQEPAAPRARAAAARRRRPTRRTDAASAMSG